MKRGAGSKEQEAERNQIPQSLNLSIPKFVLRGGVKCECTIRPILEKS